MLSAVRDATSVPVESRVAGEYRLGSYAVGVLMVEESGSLAESFAPAISPAILGDVMGAADTSFTGKRCGSCESRFTWDSSRCEVSMRSCFSDFSERVDAPSRGEESIRFLNQV